MTGTEENRETVRRAWRAFAGRDPERIAAFFTEDAQWTAPAGNATAVALGAPHHMAGRAQIVHFLTVDFPRLFVRDVASPSTASTPPTATWSSWRRR
ncbi:nuclear transport factor 2 family protein [Streptomyces armeniacus]|uniref:nuclear transport factor 2 family protein n=1 Tax=Streptomyces armeniacus TaxID=83291 RepID=UPI001FEA3245|nr:nuclear transport factor 2 family protein [Streptomyces armeniacus]